MTRTAMPRRCRRCKQPTLRGLDGDVCAWPVEVDPTPLAPAGEALALLAGRATFHLRGERGSACLDRRDRWQIAGQPAGTVDRLFPFDVVASHECNSPPLPSIQSNLPIPATATNKECDERQEPIF